MMQHMVAALDVLDVTRGCGWCTLIVGCNLLIPNWQKCDSEHGKAPRGSSGAHAATVVTSQFDVTVH